MQVGLSSGILTYRIVVKLISLKRASLRYMKFHVSSVEKIIVYIDDVKVNGDQISCLTNIVWLNNIIYFYCYIYNFSCNLYYYYQYHVIQVMNAYARMLGLKMQHSLEYDNQNIWIESVHIFQVLLKLCESREDVVNFFDYKIQRFA